MAAVLTDTAAKWSGTAASPRVPAIHSRAACAFASVSCVVKVFEETMNRVVAGSAIAITSEIWQPSTFETKTMRGAPSA